jgi:hypothetical protein
MPGIFLEAEPPHRTLSPLGRGSRMPRAGSLAAYSEY